MSTATPFFQCANGATVRIISAKELLRIPVWQNNRTIDHRHADNIRQEVGDQVNLLDHGYHIGVLDETDAGGNTVKAPYIIDGQHRLQVLKHHFDTTLCAEDFPILIYERHFATEGELIDYFNALNNSKPVRPWRDEVLMLNKYIAEIERTFHSSRQIFIRPAGCHRPYLSAEKLREALRLRLASLVPTEKGAMEFAARIKAWNDDCVARSEVYMLGIRGAKKREYFERGAKIGFVLTYDDSFKWMDGLLTSTRA